MIARLTGAVVALALLGASQVSAQTKAGVDAPWRVAKADGSIEIVAAPALVRDDQYTYWPVTITREMLVAAPTPQQIDGLMPPRALEREKIGAVVLEGRVQPDGTFVWRIDGVTPEGWGFDDAAIRVGALYRAPSKFPDGRSTIGTVFNTVISFTTERRRPIVFPIDHGLGPVIPSRRR